MKQRKPFIPSLGETYSTKIGKEGQTCSLFFEQVNINPPCTLYLIESDLKIKEKPIFTASGSLTLTGQAENLGDSFRGKIKGVQKVKFWDKTEFQFTLPEILVQGLLYGQKKARV